MKSTFVLFVLCAGVCLSASAQSAYSPAMKLAQFQKSALQKEKLPIKSTVKKKVELPVRKENLKQQKVLTNYYLPTGYSPDVKWNTVNKEQQNSVLPHPAIKQKQ